MRFRRKSLFRLGMRAKLTLFMVGIVAYLLMRNQQQAAGSAHRPQPAGVARVASG